MERNGQPAVFHPTTVSSRAQVEKNCSDARGPGVVGRVQHDNSGCFFAPTAQGGGCAMIRLRVRITYAPKRTTWEQHLEYHFRLAQKAPFSENVGAGLATGFFCPTRPSSGFGFVWWKMESVHPNAGCTKRAVKNAVQG
uniref:Uncharacterized protein n=1 Tax=Anopheles coluzzii TaxID=1518534 RepID=A0A8W7PUN8_ANOCL